LMLRAIKSSLLHPSLPLSLTCLEFLVYVYNEAFMTQGRQFILAGVN